MPSPLSRQLAALLAVSFVIGGASAAQPARISQERPAMQIQSSYPVIVTRQLEQSRDFYVQWLGFEPLFEASWFVYLQAGNDQPWGIAFMSADHPSKPPGPETFTGKGAFLTLQVEDAAAEFKRFQRGGVAIAYPLKDEAWGQRRFGIVDPSGMWIDIVQQTEPAPGYWEQYMKR